MASPPTYPKRAHLPTLRSNIRRELASSIKGQLESVGGSIEPSGLRQVPAGGGHQIAGYATLCTYSGIAELSEEAITKAVPADISKSTSAFSDAERAQYLVPIVSVLGLPAGTQPTDNDYVALAVMADPSTTDTKILDAIAKTFSSNIPAATVTSRIYDSSAHTKNATTLSAAWSSPSNPHSDQ